jgi:NADPH:quinone reductase-like Zn-dependent oxidoreductase
MPGYGPPDGLRLDEVAKPLPKENEILIRIHAASVNPADYHSMRGTPWIARLTTGLRRPKSDRLGIDLAGTVEAVGRDVTHFKPGDAVYGARNGSLAEYIVTIGTALAPKPGNLTFEQAAAVPVAGFTALQGLRDHGRIRAGQRVLVNGAAGGVGTLAVQIARALGAEVTGVTSTRNLDLVRSIGADRVIDYTLEAYTAGGERYDLVLDCVGNHALGANRQVMTPEGVYVMVGGPIRRIAQIIALNRLGRRNAVFFIARANRDDLLVLTDLIEAGRVTPVIDRRYPFGEAAAALRYLETGRARGKVVVAIQS